MRQIQSDYPLITGGHDVIFEVGVMLLVLASDLHHLLPLHLGLWSRVSDRLVELTETVFCFDYVEILPVCLGQRERFRETLVVQSNLPNILRLLRLKLKDIKSQ